MVRLDKDTGICADTVGMLNAGNFAAYDRNNGAGVAAIPVTGKVATAISVKKF